MSRIVARRIRAVSPGPVTADWREGPVAIKVATVPPMVRRAFVVFAFTVPLEAMSGAFSLAKMSGLFFTLVFLYYYNPFCGTKSLPKVPTAMWWFLGYLLVYVVGGLFLPEEAMESFVGRIVTLSQLFVLFWFSSEVLQDNNIARNVVIAYVASTVFLALGVIAGLPGFADLGDDRVAAMGENPNDIATFVALGAVALIGPNVRSRFKHSKAMLWFLIPLLVLLVRTGSRAPVGGFVVGCGVYLLLNWQSRRKFIELAIATLGIVALVYIATSDPTSLQRWQATYYDENVAGRDKIFSEAMNMFWEHPLFGWHPVASSTELGLRLGKWERDTHNLLLHLLLEVGLLGTIPFLLGLYLCLRAAWQARSGILGAVPLALLATMLTVNVANNYLVRKPLWLFLSLAVGVASRSAAKARMPAATTVAKSLPSFQGKRSRLVRPQSA